MHNNPKVSIVIPVYNGEDYIGQAIDSALSQTYKNIEIIVVNDGSSDNTEKIVKSYGGKLKYYKKENGGVATALNLGIEKMTGDYFSWLSHDDLYEKDKISKQIAKLSECDDKTILFSNYNVINEKGETTASVLLNHDLLKEHHEKALFNGMINGITLLIPVRALKDCGYFKSELKCTQDYDLWYRMLLKGYRFYHINESFVRSRVHANQTSNTSPLMIKEGNNLWLNIIRTYPIEDKKRIWGNEFDFYSEMALFLNIHQYKKALNYCVEECKKIDKVKTDKLLIKLKQEGRKNNYNLIYLIEKVILSLKNNGVKRTTENIKRFISRR